MLLLLLSSPSFLVLVKMSACFETDDVAPVCLSSIDSAAERGNKNYSQIVGEVDSFEEQCGHNEALFGTIMR